MSNYNDDRPVVEERYAAPVAETVVPERSFWSRFWWLLPLLALLIALPFILRGCNRHETPVTLPATVEPAAPAETTPAEPEAPSITDQCAAVTGTVNFRWWGDDNRANMQREAIEAFNAHYPNITVNVQPVAFAGYWDQLQVEAIAGNTPDLFTSNEAWLSSLVSGNVLADLRQIPTVDLSHFSNDALGAAVSGNHVYAVPTGGNAASLLVNLDLLEEAGIPIPNDETWTWEDFKNIATQVSEAGLTNENGESVFGISHLGGQQVGRVWANQSDGGMFTPAGELNWSEESIERYMQLVEDLIASGAAPSAALQQEFGTTSPGESLMALGRSAFQPQWSNQLGAVANAAGGANLGLMRFPGDMTSPHMGTWLNPSMFFAVSSNAQNPEAAGCLLNFMVNSPEAANIMGIDRGVPFNEAMLAVIEPNLTGQAATQAEFMNRIGANAAASVPLPELNDDLNNILGVTERVMFGQDTPASAATLLRNNLQDAIVRN